MSMLNGGLKIAISALNLLDIYKALVCTSSTPVALSHLGTSKSTVQRLVRDGVGTPTKVPHTKFRVGSARRREQLKATLSLAVVWTVLQTMEPMSDSLASVFIPFYGTFKTCLLIWILFGRTSASMRLVQCCIQPVIHPYEVQIDALFALFTSLSSNLLFLSSLPLAHMLIWLRRNQLLATVMTQWRSLWAGHAEQTGLKREQEGASPDTPNFGRVPPPVVSIKATRKKPPPSSPPPPHGGLVRPVGGSNSGMPKQPPSRFRKPSNIARRPATMGLTVQEVISRTDPDPTSKARHVSGSSTLRRTTDPTFASAPRSVPTNVSQAKNSPHRDETRLHSIEALDKLPPVPQGFSRGVDGGFAFIPPATPPAPIQQRTIPLALESPLSLDQLFSPIFPGSFASLSAEALTPLRMPEDAKAMSFPALSIPLIAQREAMTSSTTRTAAKPIHSKQDYKKPTPSTRSTSPRRSQLRATRSTLFLSDSVQPSDNEEDTHMTSSPPTKRKGLRSSTSMVLPSSKSKRQKLDVLADVHDDRKDSQRPEVARRTRGASAALSAVSSRASSLGPAERAEHGDEEQQDGKIQQRALRASVSTRSLRQRPFGSGSAEEARLSMSKPPVSGLRKGGRTAGSSKSSASTRSTVK